MKAAVSNLAWPAEEERQALAEARLLGLLGIEIAPVRTFGSLDSIDLRVVRAYRDELDDRDLQVPSLQGVLFGVAGAHLFRDSASRQRMLDALLRVGDIAAALGARAIVFGAPQLRDPGSLEPRVAQDLAVDFFRSLGPLLEARGTVLAIEANPALYNCRFITRTLEACALVERIASRRVTGISTARKPSRGIRMER